VQKKLATTSGGGSDLQDDVFVYDFLYYDARRVGSFQAQLGSYGALKGIKHHAGSGESSTSKAGAKATAGVPTIAGGEASKNDEASVSHSEGIEREYDPFWINGLSLYEELDKFSLIERDLANARIGQFVLMTGSLCVLDFSNLKAAWKSPSIKAMMMPKLPELSQNATGTERRAHKQATADQESQFSMSIDILESMPHTVQATLTTPNASVWCTLGTEGMVSQSSEVMLKHGISVGGDWALLGILDALPDEEQPPPGGGISAVTANAIMNGGTPLGVMVATIAPIARTLLGRPSSAYGVTALLIFREVSAS
jgi:hypothetical protein